MLHVYYNPSIPANATLLIVAYIKTFSNIYEIHAIRRIHNIRIDIKSCIIYR